MTDFLAPIIESLRFEREGIMVSHGNAPIKQVGGNGSGAMPQPTLVQGSYDTGTPYVPHDMTANIHEGEIIIDPQSSNVLRKYGINVNQESLMKQTKNMVEEEGYRQSRIKSTNNENYSNTKTDIIAQLEKENAVLVSGFNTLASQLDELVDFNNERRSEGYKTEVVGTVTAVGA
jgi:hypothetical protein